MPLFHKIYIKANASALIALNPITVHPDWITFWFVIMLAVSQIKCLTPLKQWNVNKKATDVFVNTFSARGHAAKDAAITADSRCHPTYGAIRYAVPKR